MLLSIPFLFWFLLWVLYPKHISQFQRLKNIPFFQNFAVFDTLFNVRTYTDCWKKNNPFYLFSCTSIISTFEYKWPPWGLNLTLLQNLLVQLNIFFLLNTKNIIKMLHNVLQLIKRSKNWIQKVYHNDALTGLHIFLEGTATNSNWDNHKW